MTLKAVFQKAHERGGGLLRLGFFSNVTVNVNAAPMVRFY